MADAVDIRYSFSVEIFPSRIQKTVDRRDGPAGRRIQNLCRRLLAAAIPRIGTEYSGTTGRPSEPRPGSLRDSGEVVHLSGAAHAVRFNHPIAAAHHNGATGHPIGGRGKLLRNRNSPVRGPDKTPRSPFKFVGEVIHPGHAGNPFLTDAVEDVPELRASGTLRRGPTAQNPIFRATTIG